LQYVKNAEILRRVYALFFSVTHFKAQKASDFSLF
jgi:hypothetical protein